mgnify:CR=1 FL=1
MMPDPHAVYTATGDRVLVFGHIERRRMVWLTHRLLLWESLLSRVLLWR